MNNAVIEEKLDAILSILNAGYRPYSEAANADEEAGVEMKVRNLLLEIGMPDRLIGHRYTLKAICAVVEDPGIMNAVTTKLYPLVAKAFGTTPSRVERGIRHAVEVAWDRGDLDTLQRFFGYTVSNTKGKPTNSEFISRMANITRFGV